MTAPPKGPSANERALAKLLREAAGPPWPEQTATDRPAKSPEELASFLARRGVLAVSAKTVADPNSLATRAWLRRLARGAQ